MKWARIGQTAADDTLLVGRAGYHSLPSVQEFADVLEVARRHCVNRTQFVRQLFEHKISQDVFDGII
jgi:hypothetical protein